MALKIVNVEMLAIMRIKTYGNIFSIEQLLQLNVAVAGNCRRWVMSDG